MPNPETGPQGKKSSKLAPAKSADRGKPTRFLPTNRIAFENQLNILRGYAAASGASLKSVTNDDVAKVIGTTTSSTVSLANAFFVESGLLSRNDQGLVPSESVVAFARAWEWSAASAGQKLAPVLQRTWFADVLFPRLSFNPLSEEEAISELGGHINAGTDYRPQLKLLIDYLEVANLIRRDNGSIRLVSGNASTPSASSEPAATREPSHASSPETPSRNPALTTSFAQATQGIINFHVDVRVDMAEFSDWSPERITAFFGGVAQVLAAKSALEKGASG